MKIKEAVTKRIYEICEQRGLKKNAIANMAGITPSTLYSAFDSDRKDIGITTIKKICDGLDISIIDFFDVDIFKNLEQEIE